MAKPVEWSNVGVWQIQKQWLSSNGTYTIITNAKVHPSASGWAPDYQLKNGERMIQYTILGLAEMEVDYDRFDNTAAIFTSYE